MPGLESATHGLELANEIERLWGLHDAFGIDPGVGLTPETVVLGKEAVCEAINDCTHQLVETPSYRFPVGTMITEAVELARRQDQQPALPRAVVPLGASALARAIRQTYPGVRTVGDLESLVQQVDERARRERQLGGRRPLQVQFDADRPAITVCSDGEPVQTLVLSAHMSTGASSAERRETAKLRGLMTHRALEVLRDRPMLQPAELVAIAKETLGEAAPDRELQNLAARMRKWWGRHFTADGQPIIEYCQRQTGKQGFYRINPTFFVTLETKRASQ